MMPRGQRISIGGIVYHVLNRGNDRRTIFHKAADGLRVSSKLEAAFPARSRE
jgi:hypothetical protein